MAAKTEKEKKAPKRANGMGSITYLGKTRRKPWAVRVTDEIDRRTGRQKQRYIGYYETETEAKKALGAHYANPVPKKSNITLKQLYEEWRPVYYKRISKSTQNCYNAAWAVFAPYYNVQFKEIRTNHIEDLIANWEKSKSSKEKAKALYSLLCNYAQENDIINKNYAEHIYLGKEEKSEKEVFTDLEVQEMKKKVKTVPNLDLILIMVYTSWRISEFLALTPFSIDLKAQTMTGGMKTEAGKNRVNPIHPDILKYVTKRYNKNAAAFVVDEEGKPYTAKRFRETIYYPALEQAGIKSRTPHSTRHTYATRLQQAGVDPETIKYLMGHTKYSFTVDTYIHHPSIEKLATAVNKL